LKYQREPLIRLDQIYHQISKLANGSSDENIWLKGGLAAFTFSNPSFIKLNLHFILIEAGLPF